MDAFALTYEGFDPDQEGLREALTSTGNGYLCARGTAEWEDADGVHYPGHVHNDYLQLAYEFGIWAAPAYLIYAAALVRTESPYWPAFAGFAAASVFFFPLYTPVTAIMGSVLAGHILGEHYQAAMTGKQVNAAV